MLMRNIEGTHGGIVRLTVSPAGIGATGGLVMVLSFDVESVVGPASEQQILVVNRWPCTMHSDWWACVFEGLFRLDAKIGRDYSQQSLKEA
jgi:hypothetical protein